MWRINAQILSIFVIAGFAFSSCKTASTESIEYRKDIPIPLSSYDEEHRPQLHFSPPGEWMNDPNGMVYYEGEYHLFYQHYPDSNVWGPMHWGHAVSKDLIHWENLPIALYPDELGYIFSGSAVMDYENTSGFGEEGKPAMVAIYTYHDPVGAKEESKTFQTQGIAYSTDKGRSWTKYEGNPVIPNPGLRDFRDPKVFWHKESSQWVMIFARGNQVQIYNSPDLKAWTLASEFGEDQGTHAGVWECPDLFELPIDDTGEKKWMMIVSLGDGNPNGGSGTMYFVGDFDGKTFSNENPKDEVLWLEYGRDNYAGVTWSDIPETDGRRIFMGWMSNWRYAQVVPTYAWRSAMTLARELSFTDYKGKTILKTTPVVENEAMRINESDLVVGEVAGLRPLGILPNGLMEIGIKLELDPSDSPEFIALQLSNLKGGIVRVGYKTSSQEYFIDRQVAGKSDFHEDFATLDVAPAKTGEENILDMRLFVDVSSVELFADEGRTVMTDIYFPTETFTQLSLLVVKGKAKILAGKVWELEGVWK
ncbi:MAG: glycoside hydrolase family 32 protein [Bacteroidota bacterium]